MATTCLSYRDIPHPSHKDIIKNHNNNTLKLVKTVAEFAQKISLAHEQFAAQIQSVVDLFCKRNQDLKKDRPAECHNTLNTAWEALLQETQIDAQAHADTANLLIKKVYNPLSELTTYKKSQSKKIFSFRESFESLLSTAEENVHKCRKSYVETYQVYRSNTNTRDSAKNANAHHNAHNEYLLQLRAADCLEQQYHQIALPYLLEELEEIHIDLANTLNGAIESHALVFLTKATEQSERFDNILKICTKQVNPKTDIHHFLVSVSEELVPYAPKKYTYAPPSDPNIPGSEAGTNLKENIVRDRHTDAIISTKRRELQKEAMELTSYLKQNQDITQTLMSVCQRNLANHQYAKVYETQEDLCRKRNEIRMASLQLAAIRAQIDMLSPKSNGTAVEGDDGMTKPSKTTIRWMWKNAFRNLKTRDKEKDRDKDRDDRSDKSSEREEKKYSRMNSRQSSMKKSGLMKQKDSKEQAVATDEEPEVTDEVGEIDPVYSLLKCAADLPRQSKLGQGHACCLQRANENLTVRPNSRSSSPLSGSLRPTYSSSTLSLKSEIRSTASSPRLSGVHKAAARVRRVQFQQDSRKSQSLETPYHHTYHQRKLGSDMGSDVGERSHSYNSIAPQAYAAIPTRNAMITQHSLSGEISEHEKWEKEGGVEYIVQRGKKAKGKAPAKNRTSPILSTPASPGQGVSMNHLAVTTPPPRSVHRELKHQRSYSTGDLSPTLEKWEKESMTDSTAAKHQGKPGEKKKPAKTSKSAESPEEKKSSTDRRKGWVKHKQKSKSFDFSWRVGSMWSPVEDRKSYSKELLLMQSEPRRPRPKPPSMLELDSGSSYESRDVNFSKGESKNAAPGSEKPSVNGFVGRPHEWKCPIIRDSFQSPKSSAPEKQEAKTQDRRRSAFTERKSHSLDSSIEDYHSSSQEKDGSQDQGGEPGSPYQNMTARDRRLKLQEQRRSRSLDAYDPISESRPLHIQRQRVESREKIHESGQRRKSRHDLAQAAQQETKQKSLLEEPREPTSRSRRASDIVTTRGSRRPSDVLPVTQPRRASDFVSGGSSPHRRVPEASHQSPSRRQSEAGGKSNSGRRASELGSSPSPRRASDISPSHRASQASRRTSDVPSTKGGSPSQRTSADNKSNSPSRRPSEVTKDRSENSWKKNDAKKAFTQQKSFSFDVPRHPISEQRYEEAKATANKYRAKGRILPQIPREPPGVDQSLEGSPKKQVEMLLKTREKRCHFAEQKSFSYETTAYSPAPPQINYKHRNSEPVVIDINRRRDYMDDNEVPTNISPQTKKHSQTAVPIPKIKEPSPERRGVSLEQGGAGSHSPRGKNMRQEAVDKMSTGRAATSPAAFSMSYGSVHQSSLSQMLPPTNAQHQKAPSPQRENASPKQGQPPRVRKSESVATGPDQRSGSHQSPQDQRRNRRKKFSEQKSFSYEVATTYQPVNGEEYGGDYAQVTRARTARDKRLIMMKTRASHSLDDIDFQKQMAHAQGQYGTNFYDPGYRHLPPPLGYMYMGQYHPVPPDHAQMSLSPPRGPRPASRSPSKSPDRNRERDISPRSGASRSKLMMMHSMKAVAHEGNQNQPQRQGNNYPENSHAPDQRHLAPPPSRANVPQQGKSPPPPHGPPLSPSMVYIRHPVRDYNMVADPHGYMPYYDYSQPMYEDPRYLPPGYFAGGERFVVDMSAAYPAHFQYPDPSMNSGHVTRDSSAGHAAPQTPGTSTDPKAEEPPRSPRESQPQTESRVTEEKPPEPENDFETKPVIVGPQPAVLIKPLPRDALRKDRYSDGKPFWKFWKS